MWDWPTFKHKIDQLIVWGNREPILTVRRVLWAVTTGWALFVAFCFAAVGMIMSIVGIPFALQAIQFALLCLDPIPRETYADMWELNFRSSPWGNPLHPLTIVANVLWLIFFGWGIVLLFWAAALVQLLTVIGAPTALQMVNLSLFALWPFGRGIRMKQLPTTIEELQAMRAQAKDADDQQSAGPYQQATFEQRPAGGPVAGLTSMVSGNRDRRNLKSAPRPGDEVV